MTIWQYMFLIGLGIVGLWGLYVAFTTEVTPETDEEDYP